MQQGLVLIDRNYKYRISEKLFKNITANALGERPYYSNFDDSRALLWVGQTKIKVARRIFFRLSMLDWYIF